MSVGAKTGKLRKTPPIRVEHDGTFAAVASLGGAPKHPVWCYNLVANPHVELQDGTPQKQDMVAREMSGTEGAPGGNAASRRTPITPTIRRRPIE